MAGAAAAASHCARRACGREAGAMSQLMGLCRLSVSPDLRPLQEPPCRAAVSLLNRSHEPLPDAEPCPAGEGLCRPPPWAELAGKGSPKSAHILSQSAAVHRTSVSSSWVRRSSRRRSMPSSFRAMAAGSRERSHRSRGSSTRSKRTGGSGPGHRRREAGQEWAPCRCLRVRQGAFLSIGSRARGGVAPIRRQVRSACGAEAVTDHGQGP